MRGKDYSTVNQPPNHRLFDYSSDNSKLTPLLRKHLEDANVAKSTNAAPTINFSIRKELVDLLCLAPPPQVAAFPQAQAADVMAPPVYTAPPPPHYNIDCPTLLQAN